MFLLHLALAQVLIGGWEQLLYTCTVGRVVHVGMCMCVWYGYRLQARSWTGFLTFSLGLMHLSSYQRPSVLVKWSGQDWFSYRSNPAYS